MDYSDFLKYACDHTEEMKYDTSRISFPQSLDNITLSEEDISLITQICQKNAYAVLNQYHNWLSSQS